MNDDPHKSLQIKAAGVPLADARAAVLLVHGRGASAESILSLSSESGHANVAYIAPQANNWTWYPHSFLAPIESNEPWLSSALDALESIVQEIESAEIPREQIVLAGFSQGACLAVEYAARNADKWGGLCVLSGGLIGPEGTPRSYQGSFSNTPTFIGCADVDPHIPLARVHETVQILEQMDAHVDLRIYPDLGHTINADEIQRFNTMIEALG